MWTSGHQNQHERHCAQRNQHENQNNGQQEASYATAARSDRYDERNHDKSNGNSRRPSTRSSFRNLRNRNKHDNGIKAPLHKRISLHRKNSRQNLDERYRNEQDRRQDENMDKEIEVLRSRLQELESNQTEQVLNHQIIKLSIKILCQKTGTRESFRKSSNIIPWCTIDNL